MSNRKYFVFAPLLLTAVVAAMVSIPEQRAQACDLTDPISRILGIGLGSNGYYAGQQDAIYDHDNGLAYNGQPSCITCHPQAYNDDFQRGYDAQMNSYQNTEQSANVEVNRNNNVVNLAQKSANEQQQGPSVQPEGCQGSCGDPGPCGGSCGNTGTGPCDNFCGGPSVGCDFGCGIPYSGFHYWGFHHWHGLYGGYGGFHGLGFHHVGFEDP